MRRIVGAVALVVFVGAIDVGMPSATFSLLAGALLGLIQIVLLVRRSIWNFPVAMAMVALIGVTLFSARLYAECGLQAFFFVVNAKGWRDWARAGGAETAVAVRWLS